MKNKINLISGESYNLAELFSGNRRIIIPDLQRDYCWGDNAALLVSDFLNTLLRQFNNKKDRYKRLSLGLIYGYEVPENHVQLCDGQQRITTLYLLVGMLNRWSGDNRFVNFLINGLYSDKGQTYLQYSIRESTLYFIDDLVRKFFVSAEVSNIENIDDIKACDWYFDDYNVDYSIQSMLGALSAMEKIRNQIEDIDEFAEFLLHRLMFIYYDLENRALGEETFVVINTTGEPLTPTENLKPLILSKPENKGRYNVADKHNLNEAEAWEEIEIWFWQNRDKKNYDTADNGLHEFLRWIALIVCRPKHDKDAEEGIDEEYKRILESKSSSKDTKFPFPFDDISLSTIVEYFNVYLWLQKFIKKYFSVANGNGRNLSQIDCFVLLPILQYAKTHRKCSARDVSRLFEFLRNIARIENVSRSVSNLVDKAIEIGESIGDVVDILNLNDVSKIILTDEEAEKLQILKDFPTERSRIEKAIWHVQNLNVDAGVTLFKGEIAIVIAWAKDSDVFDIQKFEKYSKALEAILKVGDNDLTRRALLCLGFDNYPVDGWNYGWSKDTRDVDYDTSWKNIITTNSARFKDLLDTIIISSLHADEILTKKIADNSPKLSHRFRAIATMPQLLAYCNYKRCYHYKDEGLVLFNNYSAKRIPLRLACIALKLGAEWLPIQFTEIAGSNIALHLIVNKNLLEIYFDKSLCFLISSSHDGIVVRNKENKLVRICDDDYIDSISVLNPNADCVYRKKRRYEYNPKNISSRKGRINRKL